MDLLQQESMRHPAKWFPFAVIAILPVFFWPTFSGLSHEWTQWDESLSHAYPVLLWFAYLLFKASPLPQQSQPWWLNFVLATALLISALAWFLFHLVQIKLLEQLMLLPLLCLGIAWVFGVKTLWQQRFLLLLPVFTLPVWDYLTDPLVQLASFTVAQMVRWVGIPALIDGSSIFIPSGHIMIADGCSGLRYLIISLALGYSISYLNGYREKGFFLCLVIAGALGLLANWIRIFALILIGYYSEMQSSLMSDHETFGWVLFALICFPAIYFAPVARRTEVGQASILQPLPWGKWFGLLLLLAPGAILSLVIRPDTGVAPPSLALSPAFTRSSQAMPVPLQLPQAKRQQRYEHNKVQVRIDEYFPQHAKERLVPYIARQYDAGQWVLDETRVLHRQGMEVRLETLRQKSNLRKVVQVQWFDVGGYTAPSVARAKILQIPALLAGKNYFSIITLQTECLDSHCEQAIQQLLEVTDLIASKG